MLSNICIKLDIEIEEISEMIQLNWIFLGFGVLINIIIIMCVLTYYISPFHLNGIFKIIIVLIDCLICEENSAF